MSNEWVSVEDELPPFSETYNKEISDDYLISDSREMFVAYCVYKTKRWYDHDDNLYHPTHWMKLPPLPIKL